MQNKFKNNVIFLGLIISIFLIGIPKVNAWQSTSDYNIDTCIAQNNCKLVCAYQDYSKSFGKYYNINIIYNYSGGNWYVVYDKQAAGSDNENKIIQRYAASGESDVFSVPNTFEKLKGTARLTGEEAKGYGLCPEKGYTNFASNTIPIIEAICFDDGISNVSIPKVDNVWEFLTSSFLDIRYSGQKLTACQAKIVKLEEWWRLRFYQPDYYFKGAWEENSDNFYNQKVFDYLEPVKSYLNSYCANNAYSNTLEEAHKAYEQITEKDSNGMTKFEIDLANRFFPRNDGIVQLPDFFTKTDVYLSSFKTIEACLDKRVKEFMDQQKSQLEEAVEQENTEMAQKLAEEIAAAEKRRADNKAKWDEVLAGLNASLENIGKGDLECDALFGQEFGGILSDVLNLIRFLVPIIIIAFSIIDFIKAIVSQEQEKIKNAGTTLGKRITIGIVIFFVGILLSTLLSYFNIICKV